MLQRCGQTLVAGAIIAILCILAKAKSWKKRRQLLLQILVAQFPYQLRRELSRYEPLERITVRFFMMNLVHEDSLNFFDGDRAR